MRVTIWILAIMILALISTDAQAFGHRRGKRCHIRGHAANTVATPAASCSSCTASQPAPVAPASPVVQSAPVVQAACDGNCTR